MADWGRQRVLIILTRSRHTISSHLYHMYYRSEKLMEQDNNKKEKVTFKSLVAPDVEQRKIIRVKINDYAYFAIIGLISMLSVFIPPLFMGCLQSDIGLAFPKSMAG